MIRAPIGDLTYWNETAGFLVADVADRQKTLEESAGNSPHEPQYRFNLTKQYWHLLISAYSRGDPVGDLAKYFPLLLDAWEQAEALGKQVWTEQQQYTRHAWAVNLDHYIVCFWLVGLALSLEIPDEQWRRLLALIGNEGEDALLDRVIASRSPDRCIGTKLCHPKPYQRLLDAINAQSDQRAKQLAAFVSHWYKELNRPPKPGLSEMTAMYDRPYWYTYGNTGLNDSGYFGRWCIEAVAAVKAFGLNDSLCLGHEHYPGDLLRPTGPSTHAVRSDVLPEAAALLTKAAKPSPRKGLWARWFGKG